MSLVNLTEKDQAIIEKVKELYAATQVPVSPTTVGLALGRNYDTASSYCSNALRKAVNLGILVNRKGKYAVKEQRGEE